MNVQTAMLLMVVVAAMTATTVRAARYGLLRIGEPASYGYGRRTTSSSSTPVEAFLAPDDSKKETRRHLLDEDFEMYVCCGSCVRTRGHVDFVKRSPTQPTKCVCFCSPFAPPHQTACIVN
jgi:hypothetical protein